jgi:hypothetical protein
MRHLAAFGRFWWDFVVGDDWRIAAGVLVALGLGALLTATETASATVVGVIVTAAIIGSVALSLQAVAGRR